MSRVVPSLKLYFPDEDIERIKSDVETILRSGMLTLHTYTKNFEERFADVCEVKHAVAVNSGTSALEIALRSLKLANGDEILVPTNTFTSTAATVYFAGGKPVLTDVDAESLCINAKNVQEHITSKTKGVMVVHIGGLVCPEINEIKDICEDKHLFLVEDAAHAHGSTIDSRSAGSLGDVGCFSFYPTKVMTTGEGGMITTNDDKIAERAKIMRDQGKESFYSGTIVMLGYNWRLPEINAAIGLVQLDRLHEIIDGRNKIAKFYDKELRDIRKIEPVKVPKEIKNCFYKYVCLLDPEIDRDEFKRKLSEKGVKCGGEVYWPPLHLQPVYQKLLGTKKGDFPIAEDVCSRMLALPIYPQMTIEEVEYIVQNIEEVLSKL